MNGWRIFHKAETVSTNLDARGGAPGDVFTADFQTGGRGRLDHRWISGRGENLLMSAVVDVASVAPGETATLPLAVGLAMAETVSGILRGRGMEKAAEEVFLKWPNDVLAGGMKICGILCERDGDRAIAGIGLNVNGKVFPPEIAGRAVSLRLLLAGGAGAAAPLDIAKVRDLALGSLERELDAWRRGGFSSLHARIGKLDFLKGKRVSVRRTDGDSEPVSGICGGICADGSLDICGVPIYAGEATVIF